MRLVSYLHNLKPGVSIMVDEKSFVALPKVTTRIPKSLKAYLEILNGIKLAWEAAQGKDTDFSIDEVTL